MPELPRLKRVAAVTLGCKVNLCDTEAMLGLFLDKGYEIVPFEAEADIYLVNTCSVTNIGDKKSRQMIRRAAKRGAMVIAAGCYSQLEPEAAGNIEGVSIVLGTADRGRVVELAESYAGGTISHVPGPPGGGADLRGSPRFHPGGRTRAFLKIQDGCGGHCSYCVIPLARGPSRSRLPGEVLGAARRMAEHGYKEIVLTGIHAASYGKDLKNTSLPEILALVGGIGGIERIRLSSMDPEAVDWEFVEALRGVPKLCPHFHLPLQSGSDAVLRRMKRRYGTEGFRRAAFALRAAFPGVSITTDVIAGFPGETEAEFEQTLMFAESMGFAKMHVFPFSPKKGAPAATMPGQVGEGEKARRAARLASLSERMGRVFLERFVGGGLEVLFERDRGGGVFEGYAANYIKARASAPAGSENQIRLVRADCARDGCIYGTILPNS